MVVKATSAMRKEIFTLFRESPVLLQSAHKLTDL